MLKDSETRYHTAADRATGLESVMTQTEQLLDGIRKQEETLTKYLEDARGRLERTKSPLKQAELK